MQLTIEIPNQPLYDKIVWFLSKFKDDGLKIVASTQNKETISEKPFNPREFYGVADSSKIEIDEYLDKNSKEWESDVCIKNS